MTKIIVVLHNIRSTHNVGSILRTCDGFGVKQVIFSGYTPYPTQPHDIRLPHIHEKLTRQIKKTALGAEEMVATVISHDIHTTLSELKKQNFTIVGLEQTKDSTELSDYISPELIVLLIGEEINGIAEDLLSLCDDTVEIKMYGTKESFNVSVATGIALYQLSTR